MGKPVSRFTKLLGRFVKGLVGVLLIPPVVGVILGLSGELKSVSANGQPYADWFAWGCLSYAGVHLFFYKPITLFRISHAVLARITLWLFGGQVTTVGGTSAKGKTKGKADRTEQGSTLVVLSPYLVPVYVVLVSLSAWALAHWLPVELINRLAVFLVGGGLVMHLAMTADDLQQHREQFPIELYLVAIALSGLVSLLVVAWSLSIVLPAFEMAGVFAEATASVKAIYQTVINTLFF